jgi:hypothetical protein
MSSIFVIRHGEAAGPSSEQEIRALLARGELTGDDYAWREGMAEWRPLSEVVDLPTTPPPMPEAEPAGEAPARKTGAKRKHRERPAHVMTGLTGFLEVYADRLTITPKGGASLQGNGSPGIRTIPFHALVGLEYKLPGFTNGYMEFSVSGNSENPGGLLKGVSEANTFRFAKSAENIEAAGQIKTYVESRIREARAVLLTMSSTSLADELGKLATLRAQGALTTEEFEAAKQRLLG